jgi:DNA-directed RNA polymerase specialized sigma24 family protein
MFESNQQLEALLADPSFRRIMDLIAKEVMARWNVEYSAARGVVLSAVGEPAALACIHDAWTRPGGNRGLAKVIVRRRVLDLLDKDARPHGHVSLPEPDDGDPDATLGAVEAVGHHTSIGDLTERRLAKRVRLAVACFAAQGAAQRRQARLLQRYDLDEITYSELSAELACSPNALRVRVHKARAALLRHIRGCHPELEELLGMATWLHST